MSSPSPAVKRALVLSGGGARAAYQAGVLYALAARQQGSTRSPFAIVCGTSAGAINAAAMAAGASRFALAAGRLRQLWSQLHVDAIYRADAVHLLGNAGRFLTSLVPGLASRRPVSLLDNRPLGKLLAREIPFSAIRTAIAQGDLDALTITAASYTSGMSVSFCAVNDQTVLWERAQRIGVRAQIGVPHLLASSAIPFVFAPVALDGEYFGDGAVRQVAPTAPALHLGADRILVIGAARSSLRPPTHEAEPPTLAQVGSHVLASIFTDALGTDLEKVRLINSAVRQIPAERLAQSPVPLRNVDLLVITPSVELESIAHEHVTELPGSLRAMLRMVGATGEGGAGLLSYLLFEPGFIRRLIELGLSDAHAKGAELDQFLSDA
ncbi:MAG TPA: patatin-like phospholipase family protein [Casimicrobiaceae bacterium]|nr:patatin-like phospholipase family protein [Casimicrobiaceae bacterium]